MTSTVPFWIGTSILAFLPKLEAALNIFLSHVVRYKLRFCVDILYRSKSHPLISIFILENKRLGDGRHVVFRQNLFSAFQCVVVMQQLLRHLPGIFRVTSSRNRLRIPQSACVFCGCFLSLTSLLDQYAKNFDKRLLNFQVSEPPECWILLIN